jgi:hypothetical protein
MALGVIFGLIFPSQDREMYTHYDAYNTILAA